MNNNQHVPYRRMPLTYLVGILRSNNFPQRFYQHDGFTSYLTRIEDDARYPETLRRTAKEFEQMLMLAENRGILEGARMHAATEAALDAYSPKARAPVWQAAAQIVFAALLLLIATSTRDVRAGPSGAFNDAGAEARLRSARTLRCEYNPSAGVTILKPDHPAPEVFTTNDHIVAIYDNLNLKRGTGRVIYEKGVEPGGDDLSIRWQGDALWLIETAPAGNLVLTTIFARYVPHTDHFIALDSRNSSYAVVSGEMSAGECTVLN